MRKDILFLNQKYQFHLRDEADESVCNEIFKLKEYRIADEAISNAKDPIIDVGAHAGFFTMYARALNPKIKIFAIEPELKNIEAFNAHIAINKISGVKLIAGALAGETGERKLAVSSDSHNHKLIDEFERDGESAKVHVFSFQDFCTQNKIKKISLMKLDIEGGEYEVFEAMSETDLAIVNYIVLEYHMGREKSREIEEKLRENGFAVQIFPSKYDKTMGFIFGHNKRFL